MVKNVKAKSRIDKYTTDAKAHGFRSRAAYKLIQLNKKFRFLESATCVIDLCAAPGGWLQVCAKYMPVSSIKIGIDLVPIKQIYGCTTFACDITSEKCRALIKKEIKHFKADVVLHDGAPNMGGAWTKDAFLQNELVIFSVKLASEFLKEGGTFVTKVFRSSDYHALIYVLKQLFKKVEATKPLASRNESAEIFVGYLAPSYIDPKLLDSKHALKQLDDEDELKMASINSIKAMFEGKKTRATTTGKTYNEATFKEFIECPNPYLFLSENYKLKVTNDCKEYLTAVKPIIDYKIFFEDLKVLGKKEIQSLIIWRNKIKQKLQKRKRLDKEGKADEKVDEIEDENEEHYEERKLEELEGELRQMSKQKKKKQEVEKKKREKTSMKSKLSFINQNENQENEDGVEFDTKFFNYLQNNDIDIEDLPDKVEPEEEEEEEDQVEEFDLSELSEDDYIDKLNEAVENNIDEWQELTNDKKSRSKPQKKKKKEEKIEYESDKGEGGDDEDEEGDDDKMDIDNDDKDLEMDDDEVGDVEDEDVFENPLKKINQRSEKITTSKEQRVNKKRKKEMIEEEDILSSDTEDDNEKRSKKKKKEKEDEIEIAEAENTDSEEDYDLDEAAEIRAIAKKMLRKKNRQDILFNSYNRYVYNDDEKKVPSWFKEEESLHNIPLKPVTKEEVDREKEILKAVNARMPKKVLQALARKKNKAKKKFERIKQQATVISNQEEVSERMKIKQIQRLYNKEMRDEKSNKKYTVSRSFKAVKNPKTHGKKTTFVDKRLKKDKRAAKRILKNAKGKKSGGGKRKK